MNSEHLDNDLRNAYDRLCDAARDYQDTCDTLSALADGEFTNAERKRFEAFYRSLKIDWDFMCNVTAEIDRLEAETPEDGAK